MFYRRLFDFPTRGLRSPLNELARLQQQMDKWQGALSEGAFPIPAAGVFPLTNVTEDKDNYYVRAELPGINSDELDIQVTVKGISISGERKIPVEGNNVKYHRREREAGKFSRTINLPEDVDVNKVDASLNNGILTVTIPKAEIAKPRQISIK
ncbi:MAG: Hsp20/alpha crystallin family protein [Desulfobacteraceae bacterium]|jgi:HSP20 family protein|nr:Hsp20/alpha crystallin family protein [Desulfobacteraceae bacterium]MDH3723994.1 Hsp20/alpha crystallin family protein [Desulfobacteraceae bacterium]MDH3839061.1 Hsp20/alpha crystallin family protein [Desulfobacteraceae bacterium]MDH3874478.1 Hsp20/alpha crystallin family protein [Desulfobacteraceae bacterium]